MNFSSHSKLFFGREKYLSEACYCFDFYLCELCNEVDKLVFSKGRVKSVNLIQDNVTTSFPFRIIQDFIPKISRV
jgi:hypothetical protein